MLQSDGTLHPGRKRSKGNRGFVGLKYLYTLYNSNNDIVAIKTTTIVTLVARVVHGGFQANFFISSSHRNCTGAADDFQQDILWATTTIMTVLAS